MISVFHGGKGAVSPAAIRFPGWIHNCINTKILQTVFAIYPNLDHNKFEGERLTFNREGVYLTQQLSLYCIIYDNFYDSFKNYIDFT